jgi:hypothetical protein
VRGAPALLRAGNEKMLRRIRFLIRYSGEIRRSPARYAVQTNHESAINLTLIHSLASASLCNCRAVLIA